jgi:hypothetical protein
MCGQTLATRLRRWRWRLARYHSPLRLRYSLGLLSVGHRYPLLALLFLAFRVPRFFPCRLPPPPRVITAYKPEAYMDERHPDLYELRLIPLWRWRDTMQSSFYRLYEALCAFDEPLIGYETEYFWKRAGPDWDLALLRDPREDSDVEVDAEQLAVLAALAEALVAAFNWRLGLGLRRNGEHVDWVDDGQPRADFVPISNPPWTATAAVLGEKLVLHDFAENSATESSAPFRKRNIQATAAALRTV